MAEFWAEWGMLAYAAAAAWAFCEGETFVLLAAAAGAATGLIDPGLLILSVWLGSFAGDQLWFALGRRCGPRALRRFPAAERRLAAASRFLDRHGAAFVLAFRFCYGVRNVAAAACGIAGMGRLRFALLNFAAAGLWAASFVAVGWYAVGWLGAEALGHAVGALGLLLLAATAARFWARRQRATAPALALAVP
jgi:membrane protein DedA with SNARE-associated domain